MGEGLLRKLKNGFVGLALIGAPYFNSVNDIKAQEIVSNTKQEISNYKKSSKYPTLIHKLIEFENEPLNGETTCSSLEMSSLDYVIKNMEKHIPKKPASELSKKEAQKIFVKMDSLMWGQICRIKAECYQTAYIYHAVGDFYNLPINLVIAPPFIGEYHFFVRWDSKKDGHDASNSENPINEGDFNWDNESHLCFKKGFPLNDNDKYFIEEFFIPEETIEKGIYMKNLNEKEMWAQSHTIRAQFLSDEARNLHLGVESEKREAEKIYTEVINLLDKAIQLDSLYMPAYYLKAHYLGRWLKNPNRNLEEAIKAVDRGLELNSEEPELWALKGSIQQWPLSYEVSKEQEDSLDKEALKCFDKAIDLLENYRKIELSKKDRPVFGINYSKLSLLTDQENSFLMYKDFAYGDLESHFQKEKNPEERYKKLKQRSKNFEERKKLWKEQEFYEKKIEENHGKFSFWYNPFK
nr:hypothetical protein [Candidatus Woesearchaeota archaeon]